MTDYQGNFIQKMKFYRKQAGLTQAQLAELCDVSNGTIGNIECGKTKPSFDLIIDIALAMHIQPADLFKAESLPYFREEGLTNSQFEIVRERLDTALHEAVSKTLSDIKFKIDHT
ncbi:MAG: helix-turn-helix transcriptional regulator [Treponema sp.]|nr:helix-turn-helix transcriptional regulator [Treponema sp.]